MSVSQTEALCVCLYMCVLANDNFINDNKNIKLIIILPIFIKKPNLEYVYHLYKIISKLAKCKITLIPILFIIIYPIYVYSHPSLLTFLLFLTLTIINKKL